MVLLFKHHRLDEEPGFGKWLTCRSPELMMGSFDLDPFLLQIV